MIRVLLLIGIVGMFSACQAHKTFFKPTTVVGKELPQETSYRLKVENFSTFNEIALHRLERIKSLNLTGLSVVEVTQVLQKLPNPEALNVLILDSMQGNQLPNGILLAKNLSQLSLNANPALDLNKAFKIIIKLPLTFLNLQHNRLTTLPDDIQYLKNLKDLNLSHNRVTTNAAYDLLRELPRLTSLWVHHNQLVEVPQSLTKLVQLRNLYIEHNFLTTFPTEIQQLQRLWVLHAGHNRFKELPVALADMPGLKLLHINNNEIASIPNRFDHKKLSILGLIMDNNSLSGKDEQRWRKNFRKFFILSM